MNKKYTLPFTLKKIIEHEYLLFFTLLIATLLYVHTIFLPLSGDDYFHQLVLDKNTELGLTSPIQDLFKFSSGDPEFIKKLIEKVGFVWWSDPNLKVSFFRPLTALTHQLDHIFYPQERHLHRIHSLIWLLICIFLVFTIYKSIYKNKIISGLGLLFFAFSIHLYLPVSWIPARNGILTCCFSLITFFLYYKACSQQWTIGFILTPFFLALALLCGEASLGITAFLFSCALFIDTRKKHIALLSLLPSACVAIIWLYIYQQMGYGSANSGYYISPQDDAIKYLARALYTLPILITGAIFNIPPDLSSTSKLTLYASLITSLFLLRTITIKLIIPFIKRDKMIGFWLVSLIISLLPAMSVSASSRTLIIPGIASVGILLSIFDNVLNSRITINKSTKHLLNVILGMHIIAPIILFLFLTFMTPQFKKLTVLINPSFGDISYTEDTSLFFIGNTPLQLVIANSRALLNNQIIPHESISILFPNAPFSLHRKSDNVIVAFSKYSLFYQFDNSHIQRLFRDTQKKPLYVGEKFKAGSLNIEILELNNKKQPTKIKFLFNQKISDENNLWLTTDKRKNKFILMEIPKIGETKHYIMN